MFFTIKNFIQHGIDIYVSPLQKKSYGVYITRLIVQLLLILFLPQLNIKAKTFFQFLENKFYMHLLEVILNGSRYSLLNEWHEVKIGEEEVRVKLSCH